LIALLLGLAGAGWVTAWVRGRTVDDLEAAITTAQLSAAGYQQAVERKDRRVGENVESLQAERDAAIEAGAPPLAAVEVRTETVTVEVPVFIRETVPVAAPHDDVVTCPEVETPQVGISGRFEGLATANRRGDVFVTGKMFTKLSQPAHHWSKLVELPVDNDNSTIEVSETLGDALRHYYNRPRRFKLLPRNIKHWRVGPTVGVGVCYARVDGQQSLDDYGPSSSSEWELAGCLYAGVGVQF
jgi:hypothetical protein